MSFDISEIEAELALLTWRDAELQAITEQLEAAFPHLLASIADRVSEMTAVQVAKAQAKPKALVETIIAPWALEQGQAAMERAENSLSEIISNLSVDPDWGGHMKSAIPAAAGVGMLVASVAALPTVVSFATVTSSSFVLFATSSVSIPLLLAGGVLLAALSGMGVWNLGRVTGKAKTHLTLRLQALAHAAVFGHGLAPEARCLINDIQAAVLAAGEAEMRGEL